MSDYPWCPRLLFAVHTPPSPDCPLSSMTKSQGANLFHNMTFSSSDINQPYHRSTALEQQAEFDKLESNIFEPNMVAASHMERKASYATSSTASVFFSPQSTTMPWTQDSCSSHKEPQHDKLAVTSHHISNPPTSRNPFMQDHNAYNQWAVYDPTQEFKSPLSHVIYEPYLEYDHNPEAFFSPVSATSVSRPIPTMIHDVRPSVTMRSSASPPNIASTTEWMSMIDQEIEDDGIPKRLRHFSPQRPMTPGFARREGVRKKNARFDIPEGRSLANIDKLIAAAMCDDDVKELKQQKRLLRNRQAALDSRQRKKKHTEDLEKEQKSWQDERQENYLRINQLSEQVKQLQIQNEELEQNNHALSIQVHSLTHEKETTQEQHVLETSELRRRINGLLRELDRSPAVIAHSRSSELIDLDINPLSMNGEWDPSLFNNMLDHEEPPGPAVNHKPSTTLVVGKTRKDHVAQDPQPVASSGFLLMLLLCGAFAISKPGSNAPQFSQMPSMSEEVRVASAQVVNNILKDGAGLQEPLGVVQASRVGNLPCVPSLPAWIKPDSPAMKVNRPNYEIAPKIAHHPHLASLQDKLQATARNTNDEADFGLTPARYASITFNDYGMGTIHLPDEHPYAVKPKSDKRRSMKEALRQMRTESGARPVPTVYTRSLLWDKIPEDVLQQFRLLVQEGRAENEGDEDKERTKGEV